MTTERDDWNFGNREPNDDGRERPRRTYNQQGQRNYGYNNDRPHGNSYNNPRDNYGSRDNNYNRQSGGNFERRDNYNRQSGGNYDRRDNYNRQSGDNYNRQSGNNYNRQSGGNYNTRDNSYGNRPSLRKNYDNNSDQGGGYERNYNSYSRGDNDSGLQKKRRPRVGESTSMPRSGGSNNFQQNRPRQQFNRPGGGDMRPQQNRFNRQQNGNYNPHAKYNVQKQYKYREENFDPDEPIRLNKYLANAGVCSRREADEFIAAGVVKVNGVAVSELGTKVKRSDEVMFHEQAVKLEHKIYVLLNKPKNCVTTSDDPQARMTVMDLVKDACRERIFPVGRLDRNTTGVLLLTNDGDMASKLTHPKFLKKKIYHVWMDKPVNVSDMQKLAEGIELEDGEIHADAISYVSDIDKSQIGIEIHSGRNRIVRRMFESLGYHVIKLDRVYFAGLTKKNLKRGQWRYLTDKEVSMLRMGAFE